MSAEKGGCFCGKVRVEVDGEPDAHVLCHCLDCRKIGGAAFSNNFIVDSSKVKMEGNPKTISKVADSGNNITSHFCPDCGTTLFRTGESFPGKHLIKVGIFDDPEWPNKNVPKGELFVPERISWIPEIKGAAQIPTMPGA